MASQDRISSLVSSQVPQFIREDHPTFVEFLEKYYQFVEQPSNAVYELKKFEDNYDVDTARSNLLKYFKNKILPSFPEETELSTERIIKSARDFYAKKGTPDSFKFLFKALFNKDLEIYFPKLQILRASDGKWSLPQAFRLTLSEANLNFNLSKILKRKAYGSLSSASCIIENASRVIDRTTGREIVEIFISSVNRLFVNGEYLEVDYIDDNGVAQTFSEKIIGAISNIKINPNKRGRKYNTGDPVVINGGLDLNSGTRQKAVAYVGNVTTGSIDSVSVIAGGYGFRLSPNSLVDIITANGIGGNVTVSGLDAANGFNINYSTDSILYKKNTLLSATNFGFANATTSNISNTIGQTLSFQSLFLAPLSTMLVTSGGSFFEAAPALDVVSLYDSDYSTDQGLILIPPGSFSNYLISGPTIQFVGGSFSSENDYYKGFRLLLEKQFRTITAYNGTTKTATLNRAFEVNVTQSNILSKSLYLDTRPSISGMGRLGFIKVLNGGSNYSSSDNVVFVGTGTNAAASLAVTGGIITGVTLSNRGEGYPVPPTVTVSSATGANAVFQAIMLNDGESFDVVTSDIGQIRDFNLTFRGSDYVSTPNVSLKIYDVTVTTLGEGQQIIENDIVYQGTDINSTTFRGIVDSYDQTNKIVRIFNYSGTPTVGQPLVFYRGTTANVSTVMTTTTIAGRTYPYRYGDGKARADAEFLNGLIRYNGFYLNSDGHLSSDKKLQNADRYHNFSYELVSEVGYNDYAKTLADVIHPAGMKVIPIHVLNDYKQVPEQFAINSHAMFTQASTNVSAYSLDVDNRAVIVGTNSLAISNNDLLVISPTPIERRQVKRIISSSNTDMTVDFDFGADTYYYTSNNSLTLTLESNTAFIGDGKLTSTANSNTFYVSGNTDIITPKLSAGDLVEFTIPEYTTNLLKNSEDYEGTLWTRTELTVQNNIINFSEDFQYWNFGGANTVLITANTAVAPDGTTTADKIIDAYMGGTSSTHYVYVAPQRQVLANQYYTFSVYLKAGERDKVMVRFLANGGAVTTTGYVIADLTAGTILNQVAVTDYSITPVGNNWHRVSLTVLTAASGQLQPAILLYTTSNTYVGDNVSGLYAWGAQIVVGRSPGTYTRSRLANYLEYSEEFSNTTGWTQSGGAVQTNRFTYSEQFDNAAWTKTNSYVQTNLLQYSEQFDIAGTWTASAAGTAVLANQTTAPDGTLTGDLVYPTSSAGRIYQAVTATLTQTFSVYAKAAGMRYLNFRVQNNGAAAYVYFDLTGGVVSSGTGTIESVGNGWYRCSAPTNTSGTAVSFAPSDASGSTTSTPSGTNGVYVWGAQLVQGTVAGNYRATTSATLPISYTGPTGLLDAQKLLEDGTTNAHVVQQSVSITATNYAYSVYMKAFERTWGQIVNGTIANCYAYFDLTNGVLGTVGAGATAAIESIGSGWYRCTIFFTGTAASHALSVRTATGNGTGSYAGDGSSGIYITKAQLVEGLVAAPYTPTTSAAVPIQYENFQYANLAYKLVENNATSTHAVYSANYATPITTPNTSITLSVYAKAAERGNVALFTTNSNKGKFFNLSTGTVGGTLTTAPDSASITPAGNGWYRCAITVSHNTLGSDGFQIFAANGDSGTAHFYAGNGSGLYLYGAQMEVGTSALAYTKQVTLYNPAIQELSPLGTYNAKKLIDTRTAGNPAHAVTSNIDTLPNMQHTLSTYAKAGELSVIRLAMYNEANTSNGVIAIYDLNGTGFIATNGGFGGFVNGGASMIPLANGWFRCILSGMPDRVTSNIRAQVWTHNVGYGGSGYTGTANGGLFLYGTQLERTPTVHTYTRTNTAAATSTTAINNTLRLNVVSVLGNTVTMNSHSTAFSSNTSNIRYMVYPSYEGVSYKIITTNAVP